MTDQSARDRVVRFIRDQFDDHDIKKIDEIIRHRSGATLDRSLRARREMTFHERYPDAARIKVAGRG